MASKIYTKTGDKGNTGLFGGTRVSKDDLQIEAYGTVDELNSYIGLLRDLILSSDIEDKEKIHQFLLDIQDRLFSIGSHLATDVSKMEKVKDMLPPLFDADIQALEKAIDEMEEHLEPMKFFVLPGGHPLVSHCHIARCICRRSERNVVRYSRHHNTIDPHILPYLNRLSDYLFVLSRYITKLLGAPEFPWIPKRQ
ncbi:MAG: cob(I)yrinic acid a,c-diamide adenosyltransferase [Bacteroidia bacterium]|jgi:cob(I)alamin adenosyltransferase|nr:cob(I)yrinic acid a,c-diamide adenosyltransferase [Bacteroidia bacterium]